MTTTTIIQGIDEIGQALRDGSGTSEQLVAAMFAVADEHDEAVGVYLAQYRDSALAAAAALDAELMAGIDRGPLHGIPIGVKDIIATVEGVSTGQSMVVDDEWWAGLDAPVVERLRAAGAVIMGKTTTMEFACGLPDHDKPFPIPRNPWNLDRWPGGSSSGTGSGIATGMFVAGLGTDTGGSVRMPASFCGISGLKQTYGIVPKAGCMQLGLSLDHIGPMARSARDCLLLLEVMAGPDERDATSVAWDSPVAAPPTLEGLTIGFDFDTFRGVGAIDPLLEERFMAALAALEEQGATLKPVRLPLYEELTNCVTLTGAVEAFAVHRDTLASSWSDYGRPTREYLASGALIAAADFGQAQKVRRLGVQKVAELFDEVDLVVTPTAAGEALPIEGLSWDMMFDAIFTPYWNSVGNPALSIPMGLGSTGLPLGLQICGRPMEDRLVLGAGMLYQDVTVHHLDLPA